MNEKGDVVGMLIGSADAIEIAKQMGVLIQNVNFGIKGKVVRVFLELEGIEYNINKRNESGNIGEQVRKFTGIVRCG